VNGQGVLGSPFSTWWYADLMNGTLIVWDVETTPDLQAFACENSLVGRSDAEIREAMSDKLRSLRSR
jgi:hypothetical protein